MRVDLKVISVLILFFILSSSGVDAQSVQEYLQKGDRFYQRKDYGNALINYREALTLEPHNASTNYKAGISSLHEEEYGQAAVYLQIVYDQQPDIDPDIDYHLGMAYQKDHQFLKARQHFEALKSKNKRLAPLAKQKVAECILADSLMKIPLKGRVDPVDGSVCSPFEDIAPLITEDGNILIFTSTRSTDDYQIKSGTNDKDVYISRKADDHWATPQKISNSINVRSNDAATSVSQDGKTLLLHYEDGNGDLYISSYDNGIWSQPVALNRFINHPQYGESSACISPDGKRLYFSSNRPGGRGGFDLYVSLRGSNGDWGRPTNLGANINTRGDEESPFVDADGNVLFFSSNGHATLGESDIFASDLVEGKWRKPQNLGYPINTSADESGFVLTADGTTGYFNSMRGGKTKGSDIYLVRFLTDTPIENAAVAQVANEAKQIDHPTIGKDVGTVLKGSVMDSQDALPLQASVRLVNNFDNTLVVSASTDASGNFEIVIPAGGNYGLTTERAGYLFNSMNFDVPEGGEPRRIGTRILMVKARVGSKVVLKNIFFDTNKTELKPESVGELENIRELLSSNPRRRIQINGHTDNVGHADVNRVLSLKRAEAVVAYLIKKGIEPDRLQAKGFGSERPLVSNDDEKDGRQINRRTEIEILE